MKRFLLLLTASVLGLGLLAVFLLLALRPPQLPVPASRDRVFRDLTLVEAGREPRAGRTGSPRAPSIPSNHGSPGSGAHPPLPRSRSSSPGSSP